MNRLTAYALGLLMIGLAVPWHSQKATGQGAWVTLLDSKSLGDWDRLGDANWRMEDGAVVTDKGKGHLVSKKSYKDFQIRAELWVSPDANSGIFIRLQDAKKPSSKAGYEVNVYDQRPGPEYGTGAIVGVAKVQPKQFQAGGRWNVLDITAHGPHFVIVFNDQKSADVQDSQFAQGNFSLQAGGGTVKFRKVEIREF